MPGKTNGILRWAIFILRFNPVSLGILRLRWSREETSDIEVLGWGILSRGSSFQSEGVFRLLRKSGKLFAHIYTWLKPLSSLKSRLRCFTRSLVGVIFFRIRMTKNATYPFTRLNDEASCRHRRFFFTSQKSIFIISVYIQQNVFAYILLWLTCDL